MQNTHWTWSSAWGFLLSLHYVDHLFTGQLSAVAAAVGAFLRGKQVVIGPSEQRADHADDSACWSSNVQDIAYRIKIFKYSLKNNFKNSPHYKKIYVIVFVDGITEIKKQVVIREVCLDRKVCSEKYFHPPKKALSQNNCSLTFESLGSEVMWIWSGWRCASGAPRSSSCFLKDVGSEVSSLIIWCLAASDHRQLRESYLLWKPVCHVVVFLYWLSIQLLIHVTSMDNSLPRGSTVLKDDKIFIIVKNGGVYLMGPIRT